jgi:hypothetical protein
VSKVGIKDKDKKKESRSKPGFSGKDNQTQVILTLTTLEVGI